jgi:beta-glucanase (GH16 family)
MLLIEALSKPRHTCRNIFSRNVTMDFTGAKLTTNQKRSVSWTGTPGASNPVMLTARIKTKVGPRAWPAFWLLPTTNETFCSGCGRYGGWCVSGEIDVMERVNGEPYVYSTTHYGGSDKNHFDDCRFTRGEGSSARWRVPCNMLTCMPPP